MTKLAAIALLGGCAMEPTTTTALSQSVETTQSGDTTVTKIRVNGKSAFAFLTGENTNGSLTASRDEVAGTKALDFGYAFPHPTDPDITVLVQGAGAIPNSSFQVSHTSAELHVTTDFPINRCEIDNNTGEFECAPGGPIRFDLSWVGDGVEFLKETTNRKHVLGPTTTKFQGTFRQWSALVNGTWTDGVAEDNSGSLIDNDNITIIREITFDPTP